MCCSHFKVVVDRKFSNELLHKLFDDHCLGEPMNAPMSSRLSLFGSRYSRMVQVKFVEGSL